MDGRIVRDAVDGVVILGGGTLRDDLANLVVERLRLGVAEVGEGVVDGRKLGRLALLDGIARLDELVLVIGIEELELEGAVAQRGTLGLLCGELRFAGRAVGVRRGDKGDGALLDGVNVALRTVELVATGHAGLRLVHHPRGANRETNDLKDLASLQGELVILRDVRDSYLLAQAVVCLVDLVRVAGGVERHLVRGREADLEGEVLRVVARPGNDLLELEVALLALVGVGNGGARLSVGGELGRLVAGHSKRVIVNRRVFLVFGDVVRTGRKCRERERLACRDGRARHRRTGLLGALRVLPVVGRHSVLALARGAGDVDGVGLVTGRARRAVDGLGYRELTALLGVADDPVAGVVRPGRQRGGVARDVLAVLRDGELLEVVDVLLHLAFVIGVVLLEQAVLLAGVLEGIASPAAVERDPAVLCIPAVSPVRCDLASAVGLALLLAHERNLDLDALGPAGIGTLRVDPLLGDGNLDKLAVGRGGLKVLCVIALILRLEGDEAAGLLARKGFENLGALDDAFRVGSGVVLLGGVVPGRRVTGLDLEGVDAGTLEALGHGRLDEQVIAIVNALPAEDVRLARLGLPHHVVVGVLALGRVPRGTRGSGIGGVLLVQRELHALERVAPVVDLAHVVAVGEGDDVVPVGLALVLVAILVGGEVVAVAQAGAVDVALATEIGVSVEPGVEVDAHLGLVEIFVADLAAVLTLPAQGHGEVLVVILIELVVPLGNNLTIERDLLDAVEGKRVFHLVFERDVVLLVARHVVSQGGGELVRHEVADVVVGGVVPDAVMALGVAAVVGVHDLLLELRLVRRVGVLEVVGVLGRVGYDVNLALAIVLERHGDYILGRVVRDSVLMVSGVLSRNAFDHLVVLLRFYVGAVGVRVEVSAGVGQLREVIAAVGRVRDGLGVGRIAGEGVALRVGGRQREAELTGLERAVHERLLAGEGDLALGAVRVGEVVGVLVGAGRYVDGALAVVGEGDGDLVLGLVVFDRGVGACLLDHGVGLGGRDVVAVGVLVEIGAGVLDLFEGVAAVGRVGRGLERLLVLLGRASVELEGELALLELTVLERLSAGESDLALGVVRVGEVVGVLDGSGVGLHGAVTVVGESDGDLVLGRVVLDRGVGACLLDHGVGLGGRDVVAVGVLVEIGAGVLDLFEGVAAVGRVGRGLERLLVLLGRASVELEGELALLELTVLERLGTREGDLALGVVVVRENRAVLVVRSSCLERRAVKLVDDRHDHLLFVGVERVLTLEATERRLRHLGDCVLELLGALAVLYGGVCDVLLRVLDGVEGGDATGTNRLLLIPLNLGAGEMEGELAGIVCVQLAAIDVLRRLNHNLAVGLVGVLELLVEADGGVVLLVDVDLAVAAVVDGDLDRLRTGIVSDAAKLATGLGDNLAHDVGVLLWRFLGSCLVERVADVVAVERHGAVLVDRAVGDDGAGRGLLHDERELAGIEVTAHQLLRDTLEGEAAGGVVGVLERGGLHERGAVVSHQVAVAVVLDLDGDGLGRGVVGDALDRLARMLLGDLPLICARRGEGDLAEALGVVLVTLGHGHRARRERRGIADRLNREREGVVGLPGAAGEGLLDLDLALRLIGVVVRERGGRDLRALPCDDLYGLGVLHALD